MTNDPPLVLIVDDEQVIRVFLRVAMVAAGYRTLEAEDGSQCISMVQTQHPDIVLLDAMMPILDGFSCCAQIGRIPVLMITGLDDAVSVDRAFAAGATDYITKPIHLPVLIQRVRRLIAQSHMQRHLEEINQTLENRVLERTQALESEIERRKLAEALVSQALENERALSQLKSQLISALSHEFRNPLAAIFLAVEGLERHFVDMPIEKRARRFRLIRNSIRRITQLLDDALSLSKNKTGEQSFRPFSANIREFCEAILLDLEVGSDRHDYTCTDSSNVPDVLYLDPNLLRQILFHLLANATRYSPHGGSIDLILDYQDAKLIVEVGDRGIGIPEPEQSMIFEKFYRASNANTIPGTPGAGLGLAVVKQAVELHGGKIAVTSSPPTGTRFTVTIPAPIPTRSAAIAR